jgi:hypothetical protein
VTDGGQRQIGKQQQCTEASDAAENEILVVESPNAAVEEIIVVVAANYA